MDRRNFLEHSARAAAVGVLGTRIGGAIAGDRRQPLPVAGVVTLYAKNSHADVILGKILDGYDQRGGPGPNLKLASLYFDQPAGSKLGFELAKKHGVPVFDTIEGAVTIGGKGVPVSGILSIGEHGDYPHTEKTQQQQFPRRRFFDAIAATFEKHNRVVPVFNDKHLSWNFREARQMYDTAQQMKIPFMAGSSVPLAWRRPELSLPLNCEIESAVGIGYGGMEAYGFHALEGMQCMLERRKGGEGGVASVQAVRGEGIWKAESEGWWSRGLLESALSTDAEFKADNWKARLSKDAAFFLIEYRDGLKATVAMANGVARQFSFAARLKNKREPAACLFPLEEVQPFGHFGYLVQAIEQLIQTGKPSYPVERTLLTTGVLDRVMQSLAAGQRRYDTAELKIAYEAVDWPFAKGKVGDPPRTD